MADNLVNENGRYYFPEAQERCSGTAARPALYPGGLGTCIISLNSNNYLLEKRYYLLRKGRKGPGDKGTPMGGSGSEQGRAGKLFAVFATATAALCFGRAVVQSVQPCDSGMALVPGGTFFAGIDTREFKYVLKLCDATIGNCYGSWFESEMPRREVKYAPFCMDKYEYPNKAGEYPMTGVSHNHAKDLCRRQNKRLCARTEWEAACRAGAQEYTWVYGHTHRQDLCNDYSTGLLPSGYKRNCVSAAGVNDLTGNAAEWVEGEVSSASSGMVETYNILKGGSYRQRPLFSRCTYVDYRDPAQDFVDFGFRCCSDFTLRTAGTAR